MSGGRAGTVPAGRPARREYLLVLLLGAAGAGLVLLAVRQPWAHVLTRAPAPLPSSSASVSGQDLVPLASALGVAALAGLAAVIATRGAARRVVGVLLAVFGAGIAAAVTVRLGTADVLAAAHSAGTSPASSVTGGSATAPGTFPGGSAPGVTSATRVVLASVPWRAVALLGAAALAAAGLLTAWRGPRWPGMSSRYEQPAGAADRARPAADAAALLESLTRGVDPTEDEPAGRVPGGPAARSARGAPEGPRAG
jgi:uncharacterized membrane protein (TIGR02234 family)